MAEPNLKNKLEAAKAKKRAQAQAERAAVLEQAKVLAETLAAGVRESYDKEAKQLQDTIVKLATAVVDLRSIVGEKMSAKDQTDLYARHFAAIEQKLTAKAGADQKSIDKLASESGKQLAKAATLITQLANRPALKDGKITLASPIEIKGLFAAIEKIVARVPKELTGKVELAFNRNKPEDYLAVRLTNGKRWITMEELRGGGGTLLPTGAPGAGGGTGGSATLADEFARIKNKQFADTEEVRYDIPNDLTKNIAGTYSQVGTTITVTNAGHGLLVGQAVDLNFTTGSAPDGQYIVATVPTANTFTVEAPSATTSGTVTITTSTIYTGVAADGTAESAEEWTIIRTYFDANGKPNRERIRFSVAWDARNTGW